MSTIKSRLIKDGNSTAIRIPKKLLEISGLKDAVNLEVKKGQIVVSQRPHPRDGWDEQIKAMQAKTKNSTIPDPELSDWDQAVDDGL